MKNKLRNFISLFLLIFLCNIVLAEDIVIDAEKVDIKEKGNQILASGSVKISDGNKLQIFGDSASYSKIDQIIQVNGNVVIFSYDESNNPKYKIEGQNSNFNRNTEIMEITENVVLSDFTNDSKFRSNKIIFNKRKNLIKSFEDTNINYQNNYFIKTKNIIYNEVKKIIYSKSKTLITDNYGGSFDLSNFELDFNQRHIKAEKIRLSDESNNILKFKKGFINLNSNEIVGSDFQLKLNKEIFGNEENDPRLIGRYIISNKFETKMKKSSFTTCKNVDGKCPPWSISASEINYKKEKKIIEYKKAWLDIYDVPVAYFPYFFHPDPSVKRQSGFLFPEFTNSSNLGFSTQIPYFKAIDNDKDLTIAPRVYTNDNLFLQGEYRQAFKNSDLITDFSYNKKNQSNTHFFGNLKGTIQDSFYEMKIETVSNSDYLKKYQIKSPLIKSYNTLNSSFIIETEADDYNFSTSIDVIEDLNKLDNDRYEFLFPNFEYAKDFYFDNSFFNTINYKSSGSYRKYNTNIDEADFINNFIFNSNNFSLLENSESNLDLLIRNINTYGDLSSTYKNDNDYKILTSLLYKIEYPLFKETKSDKNFLTPLFAFRYSPNKGINLKNEKTSITFQDLFNIDRISNKTVESEESVTIGIEYKNQNKNFEKVKLGIATNLRLKEDNDLPDSSTLGQKTSDLIGYSGINISENLSFNYDFMIDQNLKETNYSLISSNYNGDKFSTSLEYLERSNYVGDESYLNYNTSFKYNESNSFAFDMNRNLDKNLTNYYNLIYKYKNDCLEASMIYNKQFYSESEINSGKNIFFKISFIPFGEINTPNIND